MLPASQLGLGSRAGLVRPPLHGLPVLRIESVTTPGSARSWTLSGGLRARPAAHPNPTFSAQRTTHTTAPCPVLRGRALRAHPRTPFREFRKSRKSPSKMENRGERRRSAAWQAAGGADEEGEGGGVCGPGVFCASKIPSFLARWRVRGPAGTGSGSVGRGQ